jgi:hypothetical protein
MKIGIFIVLLLLPFNARASPRTLGALEEFILRENIREAEIVSQMREGLEAVRRDLRLLKYGSYGWFWKPKFLQKKIKGRIFEFSSENNGPVIITYF